MPQEQVTIINRKGLHARASAKFVNTVAKLPEGLRISVSRDGQSANGQSIMGLMMLGAAKGHSIDISVEGNDPGAADSALAKLVGLVADGFGED
ncbi:MAG: HPr family phosphocarrier protein [Pseudomonadota bacterium]